MIICEHPSKQNLNHITGRKKSNGMILKVVTPLFFFIFTAIYSIASDTIPDLPPDYVTDTIPEVIVEEPELLITAEESSHSPLKATMLSATLPGLGQAYNGKYWKIPVIYAVFGGVGYAFYNNNNNYQHYRKAWVAKLAVQDGNTNIEDMYPRASPEQLERAMNGWRRYLEITYIVGAAFYVLNILDATVDAHLLDFDVGEDLGMSIMPAFINEPYQHAGKLGSSHAGIKLSFRF